MTLYKFFPLIFCFYVHSSIKTLIQFQDATSVFDCSSNFTARFCFERIERYGEVLRMFKKAKKMSHLR